MWYVFVHCDVHGGCVILMVLLRYADPLLERLIDTQPEVRDSAVRALCDAASEKPEVMPVELLRGLGERTSDKKVRPSSLSTLHSEL